MHVYRRTRCSFAVVAVRDGGTERCQRGIAGMVDHLAAVVRNDAIRDVVELAHYGLYLFGVEAPAQSRVSGNVCHQNGRLPALAYT